MDKHLIRKIVKLTGQEQASLCCVVAYQGSVPRKDYPMMLVYASGDSVGTVGGGMLEHEVIEKGRSLKDRTPLLLDFDLTNKDLTIGAGICGGNMSVLIQRIDTGLQKLFREFDTEIDGGSNPGLQLELNVVDGAVPTWSLTSMGSSTIQPVMDRPDPEKGEKIRIRYPNRSAPRLHVFGAGHVGAAVARLAIQLELETLVYDDRVELLDKTRLNGALTVPLQDPAGWKELPYSQQDYVVLASRSHRHDLDLLKAILKSPPAYVGALASKRKWALMRSDLLENGYNQDVVDGVHSPVGLKINAETVSEIAVSIMAEVIAEYRGAGI